MEVNLGVVTRNELEGVSLILETFIWVPFTCENSLRYTLKVYCILKFTLKYHIKI